ncbi:kinase-like domain-containing protein [Mycena crocata]|nr:kinase-like domain-containing protein [Mycena crocata]
MTTDIPQKPENEPHRPTRVKTGKLLEDEDFWRDHQRWLETCGYKLRPRYSPDWVASWLGTSKYYIDCEDGQSGLSHVVMDATRISDGTFVMLKQIRRSKHPNEVKLCAMFNAEPLKSDPRNHCVPLYEILKVPDDDDMVLMVMPFLSKWNIPEFYTIREIVDFVGQAIEGLQFIHKQNVAHRDCKMDNILMDCGPLYPEPRHPVRASMKRDWSGPAKHLTRTQRPVKYYIVDFGLTQKYHPDRPRPLDPPGFGGDQTVPEFQSGALCDSFAVDVYCLGNTFREMLLERSMFSRGTKGLGFLRPLVQEMVQDDPKLRPTMDQVAEKFTRIRSRLHWWTLRARAADIEEGAVVGFFSSVFHWVKQGLTLGR